MRTLFARCMLVLLLAFTGVAKASPAAGYWWNPVEGGRGFVIEIQNGQMFMAGFLYAANGSPTWVASFGPMTSATQYSGLLITFTGGQTLTGAYPGPSTLAPTIGNLAIAFTSDTTGNLTWPGGTIPIKRLDFGPGGAAAAQPSTNPQTGWYWNGGEGGRGFAVEVQGGSLYFAGYMYDSQANPTWYLANGPMSNGVFQGTWTQFGNGQTLTGTYKAPTLTVANAGSVTLQFQSTTGAVLTLPNGRQVQLARYEFSPVKFSDLVGTWSGSWHNNTFGSQGPANFVVSLNPAGTQWSTTFTIGGNVFGTGAPPPDTFSGAVSSSGLTLTGLSALFGTVNLTIDASGNVVGSGTNVQTPNVSSFTFAGTWTVAGGFNLIYTANLTGGGTASGSFILTKQ